MGTERVDGRLPFVAELTRFAELVPAVPLVPIITAVGHPVGVAVGGRRGVGRRTVELALSERGVRIVPESSAELRVLVVAETVKPEDADVVAASDLPTVIVLTKADTGGSAEGAAIPMIGLLATVTELDDEALSALRRFADEVPDLSSVDAFVLAPHPIDRNVRTRLLAQLDRFGIATAMRAVAAGADPSAVVALLHQVSNVDGVLAGLHEAAAPVRYHRVQTALSALRALAARTDDQRLWQFLAADATVVAVMAAACDVLDVDEPVARARDAVHWNRYARGPVTALHRACAADVVRGTLR